MKIAVCASMSAAAEMLAAKVQLEHAGHSVVLPANVEEHADVENTIENKAEKMELDAIRAYYTVIDESDAVLVINKEKPGIPGYIGGNTLLEMGFAYVLRKPIYLLNSIPDMPYTDEIEAMQPILLNGDLTSI